MNYETGQELFDALCQPFPASHVEWRVGSTNAEKTKGLPLCYIDARAVMDRLDSICGPENWQCNYTQTGNGSIVCNLGIRVPGGDWIWKADGAGATDFEGEKGMLSDALKRAAVRWGIGRYLYELKAKWVPIEQRGKSHFIPDAELAKLKEFYEDEINKLGWGERPDAYAYRILERCVDQFVHSVLDAQDFKEKNKGMIPQLPVKMRKRFIEKLDRVGAPATEAAE